MKTMADKKTEIYGRYVTLTWNIDSTRSAFSLPFFLRNFATSSDVINLWVSSLFFTRNSVNSLSPIDPVNISSYNIFRSSRRGAFYKKGVLRNFTKLTGKHLFQSLFFNKNAGLRPAILLKRLWHRCFPVNFTKFLKTPFSQNTSGHLWETACVKTKTGRI